MNQEAYSDCVTFDMAFCLEKPWKVNASETVHECGRNDMGKKNVDVSYTKAVKQWVDIQHSLSSYHNNATTENTPTMCMTKINIDDSNDEVLFVVQLCGTREVCVRSENTLTCTHHGKGIVKIKVQKPIQVFGDHRIILMCMTAEQRRSLASSATHQALLRVSRSCGKIEYSFTVSPARTPNWIDAQRYVSGGDADMAMKKWAFSGRSQMNLLASVGLQSFHSVLECKCCTVGSLLRLMY